MRRDTASMGAIDAYGRRENERRMETGRDDRRKVYSSQGLECNQWMPFLYVGRKWEIDLNYRGKPVRLGVGKSAQLGL